MREGRQDDGANMAGNGTGAGLKTKIAARLEGTVDPRHWDLDIVTDGPIILPVKSTYSHTWARRRERADSALGAGTIDSQIDKALKKKSPAETLEAEVKREPGKWLGRLNARALPGWHFAETCTETCDTCSGAGKVRCGNCSGSGSVNCGTCGGAARVREQCAGCWGRGNHQRSRQATRWNGQYNENYTEYYTETCWQCTGGGYNYVNCRDCNNGKVRCGRCGGSGKVTCGDCGGPGKRLYRYDREIVVSNALVITGARANHDGLRQAALGRWEAVLGSTGVRVEDLTCGDVTGEGMIATANISIPTATGRLRIHSESGDVWALGAGAEIHDGEPVLAKGLKLPEPKPESPWTSVAQHLAGTRLLREALARFNTATGKAEARRDLTAGTVLADQGWLLGNDGAMAMAMAAAFGVGKLRGQAQKKVWWGAWTLALAATAVLTWIAIRTIIAEPHPGPELVTLLLCGGGLGLALGVGAALLARRNTKALAEELGVEAGNVNMKPGKLVLSVGGMAVAIPVAVVAALFAAYFVGWPADYRQAIAGPVEPETRIVTTTTVRLRRGASERADIVATLPAGTVMLEAAPFDDTWARVNTEYGSGFVAIRYLEKQTVP